MSAKRKPVSWPFVRPYRTSYFISDRDKITDWSRVGHASTMTGAIRAATGHLVDKTYVTAIVEERGVIVARLHYTAKQGIQILGFF